MEKPMQQPSYTPQQTQAWYDIRMARITSSRVHKLMGLNGLAPDAPLQDTAVTYMLERLNELTTGYRKEPKAAALDWGTATEPLAKQALVNKHQIRMWEAEFIQHPDRFYFGGSPDGWMEINGLKHTVEIKCPYDTTEHYKNIMLSVDAATMRSKYPELYWQLQSNMLLQDTKISIFVSFDPRIKVNPENRYHEAYLERNDADIALLLTQLDKGWEYYQRLGEKFNVNISEFLKPQNIAA